MDVNHEGCVPDGQAQLTTPVLHPQIKIELSWEGDNGIT